jgi:flagellar basal-body rod protein FlgF
MNVSLYQAASALNAMDRWQETIAENLASTSAPGFKKKEFSYAAIESAMKTSGATGPGTNFAPGEIRITNVKTDVAVDGKGFFEVQMPDGSLAYTRDGEFHVDAQGQMVTKQGFKVMSDGGPIVLDLNNYTELSISASGEVSQGIDLKGRLRLVEFGNTNALKRINGSYFAANDPAANPAPSAESSVRQGALESANLSAATEMSNLITVMRIFEANQRMAQIQDERIGRTIAELGTQS